MTTISLPTCDVISPSDLAVLIAQAQVPPRDKLEGMQCISAKVITYEYRGQADGTLKRRKLPLVLSQTEKAMIQKQLSQLPPVHGAMSKAQKAKFLREFRRLNPDLEWTLALEIGNDTQWHIDGREQCRIAHFNAIWHAIKIGELSAVGAHRTPAKHAGAVLPISQAKAYLTRCGYEVNDSTDGTALASLPAFGKHSHLDAFDRPLVQAILRCNGSMSVEDVWPALVQMANEGLYGLSYDDEDAASHRLEPEKYTVSYEDSNRAVLKQTREAVRRRLERRKANMAAA